MSTATGKGHGGAYRDGVESLIHHELLDGECPLYSVFVGVRAASASPLDLGDFFQRVDDMIDRGVVDLWQPDTDGEEWHPDIVSYRKASRVPRSAAEYDLIGHNDPSFDPFALSLALREALAEMAPWTIDIDWDLNRFVVTAEPDAVEEALRSLELPHVGGPFEEESRRVTGRRVRIEGRMVG